MSTEVRTATAADVDRVRARLPLTPSSAGRSVDPTRSPIGPDAPERTGVEPSDDRTTA